MQNTNTCKESIYMSSLLPQNFLSSVWDDWHIKPWWIQRGGYQREIGGKNVLLSTYYWIKHDKKNMQIPKDWLQDLGELGKLAGWYFLP